MAYHYANEILKKRQLDYFFLNTPSNRTSIK